ncbi:MAG TPA: hypothetical protein VKB62_14635 [Streptosporangiaceae bacterium]|nr:hypothetical protein [Streptosporangiaceae bacterium]
MPDSETFDAFYARTVWNVTSQLHELAGDDGLADHAIREAYAKAYQQWYQVSGYSDSEAWVLGTAKDAYERRRSETPGLGQSAAAEASDSGTWPGFFRPAARPGSSVGAQGEPLADPDGTLAPPRRGGPGMGDRPGMEGTGAGAPGAAAAPSNYWAAEGMAAGGMAAGGMAGSRAAADDVWARGQANGPGGWYGPAAGTESPTRGIGPDGLGPDGLGQYGLGQYGLGGSRGLGRPGRNGLGSGGPSQLTTRRNIIVAGVAVAVLAIAGITYASLGGHKAPAPAANQGSGANPAGKPQQHMLAAGHTGPRSAIPWPLVGPGWALAEFSTGAPSSAGQAPSNGSYTTYLVDPEGGKYKITTSSSGGPEPQLMAWSGNGRNALFATGGTSSYQLLHVQTGQLTSLQLPAGVVAAGFTRPDGLAILAVLQGPHDFRLQRYQLGGRLEASLASLRRKGGAAWPANGCAIGCALSSPNGDYDVWGIAGAEMRVLSNAGGKATRLRVQDSGHPPSCIPVSWWNDSTILADCAVTNMPDDASRLWLVPSDGSKPTALTSPAPAGYGRIEGAWLAGQTTYVTSVISRQCASAPYGLHIMRLGQGTGTALNIPGSTSSTLVGSAAGRLLVLAQTSCQGGSSLLWFDPSAGTSRSVLAAQPSQAGVIAAVPYGNGPTALSTGQ